MRVDDAEVREFALVTKDAVDETAALLLLHAQRRIVGDEHREQRIGVGQHHADARSGSLGFVGQLLGKVIIEPVTVRRHTGNRDNNGRQGGHRGQGKQAAAQRGGKESVLRHLNDR